MNVRHLFTPLALALGVALALLGLSGGSSATLAQAGTGVIRVATNGRDEPGCGSVTAPCRTVQYAIDEAEAGEEIRVAAGLYTDVHGRAAPDGYPNAPASGIITQVTSVSKTVTVRGGYTTAFTDPPDPEANETTLDAEGGGRVLVVAGDIRPVIEGLSIAGGDATGLGGDPWGDAGGGVYVISATATIRNNQVSSSTARDGGGLSLDHSASTLSGNTFVSNGANVAGGGLFLSHSAPTLNGNTVISNTADRGGGLYLWYSTAVLNGNRVISNRADSSGGGLQVWYSAAMLNGDMVISNAAGSLGGGLRLAQSTAALTNTVVADHQVGFAGSGLHILRASPRLLHTTIARNGGGDGSGIYVTGGGSEYCTVALTNTILVSHTVGITVAAGNTATLESTLWHGNATDRAGAGVIEHANDCGGAPLFVDPAARDYHLRPTSSAVDRGVDTGLTTDMDGDVRPAPPGTSPDLGADEVGQRYIFLPLTLRGY
jgi:hypothetical protein